MVGRSKQRVPPQSGLIEGAQSLLGMRTQQREAARHGGRSEGGLGTVVSGWS